MAYLDDILEAEKKAEKMKCEAGEEAKRLIEEARAKKESALAALRKAYPGKEAEAIDRGEREADEEGKKIVEEGKKTMIALKEAAERNEEKAVKLVLKSL